MSEEGKRAAAYAAVDDLIADGRIRDRSAVGIGSGSTVVHVVARLRERARALGWRRVDCVATSFQAEQLVLAGASDGLELVTLVQRPRLSVAIDGADEVDPRSLTAIKGGGGCLAREKVVAFCAEYYVLVADASKRSSALGLRAAVPVEVLPAAWAPVAAAAAALAAPLAAPPALRPGVAKMGPVVTDNGNFLIDLRLAAPIADPAALHAALAVLPGVVDTGLFVDCADAVYLADPASGSVEVLHAQPGVPRAGRYPFLV